MIQAIFKKYGFNAMRDIWIEELLELATILQQSKRKQIPEDLIIDEIADVSFCLDQIYHLFDADKIDAAKAAKMARTKKRLL